MIRRESVNDLKLISALVLDGGDSAYSNARKPFVSGSFAIALIIVWQI
jgi:hypothetical protein